jgi:DNA segregation ATPase FtsK/SpoIIIE, S-DNA-T family
MFGTKTKLRNLFQSAGLYVDTPFYNRTIRHYPKVVSVRQGKITDTYVFTIPFQMNPEEVKKKAYAFEAVYGVHTTIKQKGATFFVEVPKLINEESVDFDYAEIEPSLKGLKLPIVAGYSVTGKIHAYDMVENPHLLIGGETGSGKSSAIRTIFMCLLEEAADRIEMYLADLKRIEFFVFEDLKCVKQTTYDKSGVKAIAKKIQKEMTIRSKLLQEHKVRHIDKYNELEGVTPKKYILFCIDEFALLKGESDVMSLLEEISCIGRALGIFLLLSLQRPDAKAVDGMLKNNLTVRMAFKQSNKRNSDIVLGDGVEANASKIERPGNFYFKLKSEPLLLQSPFLSDETADLLLKRFMRKPGEEPEPVEEPEAENEEVAEFGGYDYAKKG